MTPLQTLRAYFPANFDCGPQQTKDISKNIQVKMQFFYNLRQLITEDHSFVESRGNFQGQCPISDDRCVREGASEGQEQFSMNSQILLGIA